MFTIRNLFGFCLNLLNPFKVRQTCPPNRAVQCLFYCSTNLKNSPTSEYTLAVPIPPCGVQPCKHFAFLTCDNKWFKLPLPVAQNIGNNYRFFRLSRFCKRKIVEEMGISKIVVW